MRPAPARTGGIYFRAFYLNYHSREASDARRWVGDVVQGYRGPSLSGVLCDWGRFYAMFVLVAKLKPRLRRSQRCRNVSLEKQMVVAVVGRGDTGRPANHRPAHRTPANRRPAHGCLWHIHQLCWHSPHCQHRAERAANWLKLISQICHFCSNISGRITFFLLNYILGYLQPGAPLAAPRILIFFVTHPDNINTSPRNTE